MQENITELMVVIEQEAEILEILSDALYRQKEAALKGDVQQMNKITDSQNRALEKLNELDQKRVELVKPLAEELEIDPKDVTLSMLMKRFGDVIPTRKSKLMKSMIVLAERIKETAKMNSMIFRKILDYGEVRIIKMFEFLNQSETYEQGGKKSKASEKSGVMLNKQV